MSVTSFTGDQLRIYQESFSIAETNIEHFDNAEVICLPEEHGTEKDRMKNGWIIQQLYREGDVVLIETPRHDLDQSHGQTSWVLRSIKVDGWDDAASDAKLHQAKQPFYDLQDAAKAASYDGEELFRKLEQAIEECPAEKTATFSKNGLQNLLRMAKGFPKESDNRKTHIELVIHYLISIDWVAGKTMQADMETFCTRQVSLINSCKTHSQNGNRIFVIAGAAHLLFDKEFPGTENEEHTEVRSQGVELLRDYLKTKKFVVIDHFSNNMNAKGASKALENEMHSQRVHEENEMCSQRVHELVMRIFCAIGLFLILPLSLPVCLGAKIFFPKPFEEFQSWFMRPFIGAKQP